MSFITRGNGYKLKLSPILNATVNEKHIQKELN